MTGDEQARVGRAFLARVAWRTFCRALNPHLAFCGGTRQAEAPKVRAGRRGTPGRVTGWRELRGE